MPDTTSHSTLLDPSTATIPGSWEHIESKFLELGKLNNTTQGNGFERVARYYLLNDSVVKGRARRFTKVMLWQEWPAREAHGFAEKDLGIDLVGEFEDGSLCAIQAKGYGEDTTVDKNALSDLTTQRQRLSLFVEQIIITSTDKISGNLQESLRVIDHQSEQARFPTEVITRSNLVTSTLSDLNGWPSSIAELNTHRGLQVAPPEPLPHQKTAIEANLQALHEVDRIQTIMPCGTGKTLVGQRTMEALNTKRGLVMVPSLDLMKQLLKSYAVNKKQDFRFKVVCSDHQTLYSINQNSGGAEYDAAIDYASELGTPVTNKPDEIAAFLRGDDCLDIDMPRYVFSTYQSSAVIAEAMKDDTVPDFDIAVCDEAHMLTSVSAKGLPRDFASILDQDRIRVGKRIFMTATPKVFTKRAKDRADGNGNDVVCMDDISLFGSPAHTLSYKEAFEKGLLTDYRIIVMPVTSSDVRRWMVENQASLVQVDEKLPDIAVAEAMQKLALLKAMQKYDLKKVITYHNTVAGAKVFATGIVDEKKQRPSIADVARVYPQHNAQQTMISGVLHAKTPSSTRTRMLEKLRSSDGVQVISNVGCLGQGVDIPSLDAVMFADPRSSQTDIVQIIGRAIRLDSSKPDKIGYVILPVLVDDALDLDTMLASTAFNKVWQIAIALRGMDADFATIIDELHALQTLAAGETPEQRHNRMASAQEAKIRAALSRKMVFEADLSATLQVKKLADKFTAILVDNSYFKPMLTAAGLHIAVDAYRKSNSMAFPTGNMPIVAVGLERSWASLNKAMFDGYGGLTERISLAQWLDREYEGDRLLSTERIRQAVDTYRADNKRMFPNANVQDLVPGMGRNWIALEALMRTGGGGFGEKIGLAPWLDREYPFDRIAAVKTTPSDTGRKGVAPPQNQQLMSEEKIRRAVNIYRDSNNGKFPNAKVQTIVPGMDRTWSSLQDVMRTGGFGLERIGLAPWLDREYPSHRKPSAKTRSSNGRGQELLTEQADPLTFAEDALSNVVQSGEPVDTIQHDILALLSNPRATDLQVDLCASPAELVVSYLYPGLVANDPTRAAVIAAFTERAPSCVPVDSANVFERAKDLEAQCDVGLVDDALLKKARLAIQDTLLLGYREAQSFARDILGSRPSTRHFLMQDFVSKLHAMPDQVRSDMIDTSICTLLRDERLPATDIDQLASLLQVVKKTCCSSKNKADDIVPA